MSNNNEKQEGSQLGERLKLIRTNHIPKGQEKKMTQKEMADALGISEKSYKNYESGRNTISIPLLQCFGNLYSISAGDILNGKIPNSESNKIVNDSEKRTRDNFSRFLKYYRDLYNEGQSVADRKKSMAELIKVSVDKYDAYERGTQELDFFELVRIAKIFHIRIEDMLSDDNPEEKGTEIISVISNKINEILRGINNDDVHAIEKVKHSRRVWSHTIPMEYRKKTNSKKKIYDALIITVMSPIYGAYTIYIDNYLELYHSLNDKDTIRAEATLLQYIRTVRNDHIQNTIIEDNIKFVSMCCDYLHLDFTKCLNYCYVNSVKEFNNDKDVNDIDKMMCDYHFRQELKVIINDINKADVNSYIRSALRRLPNEKHLLLLRRIMFNIVMWKYYLGDDWQQWKNPLNWRKWKSQDGRMINRSNSERSYIIEEYFLKKIPVQRNISRNRFFPIPLYGVGELYHKLNYIKNKSFSDQQSHVMAYLDKCYHLTNPNHFCNLTTEIHDFSK